MNVLYMLDTNMVSYIAKGQSKAARARMLNLAKDEAVRSLGDYRSGDSLWPGQETRGNRAARAHGVVSGSAVKVLPWGREEAKAYGALRAKLESSGKTLENMDMQIAAHAIAVRARLLVTNDKSLRARWTIFTPP
jgi:tRNA(fMet)-specific endonuclease VapC